MRIALLISFLIAVAGCSQPATDADQPSVPEAIEVSEAPIADPSLEVHRAPPAVHEGRDVREGPVVRVTSTVLRTSPRTLGVNIGKTIYFTDNDVMAAPLVHGGFSKGRQVRVMQAVGGSDTVIRDALGGHANPGSDAPTLAEGRYYIATGARAGESGGIVKYDAAEGSFVPEHDGAPLSAGDIVLLQGPWTSYATPIREEGDPKIGIGDFRPRSSQGAVLEFVSTDGPNDQALKVTFSGQRRSRGGVAHYVLLHPGDEYEVRVRAKGTAGSEVSVSLTHTTIPRDDPAGTVPLEGEPQAKLTPDWQEFVFRGQAPNDPRIGNGAARLEVWLVDGGLGGQAQLDEVSLTNATTVTPSGAHQEVVAALQDARCGVLRYLGAGSMGAMVDDLMSASPEQASWSFVSGKQFYAGHETYMVAHQMVQLAETVDAVPWIIVGAANTPDDWKRLISYLAAPAGFDEWADRRVAHGFEEPLTSKVDKILLEAGNEWWNPAFKPLYVDKPETFAEFISHLYGTVRTHPHYDDTKIELVAGGWAANGKNWTAVLAEEVDGADVIGIAPYALHQLGQATSDEQLFGALFADYEAFFRGPAADYRDIVAQSGGAERLAVYEINTHLASGVSRDVSTRLASSVGAGVAVLDKAMGCLAALGADPIAYYQLFQRHYDKRFGLWGAMVREPDATLRARPVWLGLELANRYLIEGDMVEAGVLGSPVWQQASNGPLPALNNVPYLHAYAFASEEAGRRRLNVLVVNRHRSEALDIAFELPFVVEPSVRTATLTADTIAANNEESQQVALSEDTITDFAPEESTTVPPFSATVYRFRESAE